MADGILYRDLKMPVAIVDQGAVTLATTQKNLVPTTQGHGALAANYWTPGKRIIITAYGKMTTAATPGNITVAVAAGITDAPTAIVASAAAALILNKTNLSWVFKAYFVCRTIGSTGTMQMWGEFKPHVGLVASTAQPILVPDSGPTTTTFDTTAAGGVSIQAARSGSTAETMTVVDVTYESIG